jgi:hypothetical protein
VSITTEEWAGSKLSLFIIRGIKAPDIPEIIKFKVIAIKTIIPR